MINVSLARIMYGTNEDLHTQQPVSTSWSRLVTPGGDAGATASDLPTLDQVLHQVWSRLKHKS